MERVLMDGKNHQKKDSALQNRIKKIVPEARRTSCYTIKI